MIVSVNVVRGKSYEGRPFSRPFPSCPAGQCADAWGCRRHEAVRELWGQQSAVEFEGTHLLVEAYTLVEGVEKGARELEMGRMRVFTRVLRGHTKDTVSFYDWLGIRGQVSR